MEREGVGAARGVTGRDSARGLGRKTRRSEAKKQPKNLRGRARGLGRKTTRRSKRAGQNKKHTTRQSKRARQKNGETEK